ncbi:hypothetical protein [Isoptericola haloaureus]|uniref:Uncharacterized protein n=1 Tax=Isoptericola haloaureus TaxID=1542902 RepID=A0ABU7ZA96_9MICO
MPLHTSDVADAAARLRDARRRLADAVATLHVARGPGWDSPAADACREAVADRLAALDTDRGTVDQAVHLVDGCLGP